MTSRKKAGLAVGAGVGAAAAAALRRRWRGRSEALPPVAPHVDGVDRSAADRYLESLAAAIRIPTVSTEAGVDPELFARFASFLEERYPRVHAGLTRERIGEHTLLFTWTGADPEAVPFLLMAHQDVVPVEPGTEEDWEQPPFSGVIADGFLWGRGAMDDKGSLIGILEAVESLLEDGFVPTATVYVLLGHDEEVGGTRGAAQVAARFGERGIRLGFVLDEGGAVATGVLPGAPPLALVGIGEKASLDVELTAFGEGGHSSLPPAHTAVGRVASAVAAIERRPMAPRLETQRAFLESVAEVIPGPRGTLLRNSSLSAPLLRAVLTRSPQTNALIRTTMAATVIRGGVKSNVLPQEATALVNVRILPGDTEAAVLDHIRSVVGDAIRVQPVGFGVRSDPPPLSSTETPGFAAISATIAEVFPQAAVAPWILLGATDSRYFTSLADGVYRFAPISAAMADLSRIHGTGERLAVTDAAPVVGFYRRLIVRAGGPA